MSGLVAALVVGCGAVPPEDEVGDLGSDVSTGSEVVGESDGGLEREAAIDAADGDGGLRRDSTLDAARDASTDARRDAGVDLSSRDLPRSEVFDGGAGRCPDEMTLVAARVCVDRWEASLDVVEMDGGTVPWSPFLNPGTRRVVAVSRPGVTPQGYVTGAGSEAACRAAGKRLCALDEWLSACRGPSNLVYPYGNTYVRRRCNEGRTPHPVVQYYGTATGVFTFERMNNPGINMQPDTLARTGAFEGCASPWGIFDMVGNLHEWIADPAGTFKGGFYVDAEINGRGCLYTTTAHAFSYRDYSTGFRCCAPPR